MSEAEVAMRRKRAKWILFFVVAALSLAADQATKIWARDALPLVGHGTGQELASGGKQCLVPDDIVNRACQGKAVPVIDDYWDWRLAMNSGSAFGLLAGKSGGRIVLTVVGLIALVAMVVMLRRARDDQRILHWALGLVVGGAVGNLFDRIYFGVVTDFVVWRYKTHEWPVFNVADVVLVIGVGLMFIDVQKEGKRDKARKAARDEKARAAGLVKDLQP